ncbi:MAG: FAD-linked oxidase C-terminal domain-containing protein [bacterium]|nr:FAD-linked oxidase C-terminal domain-containing protein [bacterium]
MLTEKQIKSLRDIAGTENVFFDSESIEKYSQDETPNLKYPPDTVVILPSLSSVKELIDFCNRENVPIVPRGAGTGTTGGCLPVCGGIVVSFEKLNKIIDIDENNLMAVVEPGVITGNLNSEAEKRGLFYPVDPASLDSCTLGGNVAENAGGPRAVKYGVTGDYVCGIKAVLPDGTNFVFGGKIVKNVMGYDIPGILVGSEGTLAIFREITFKLIPSPHFVSDLLVPFASIRDAAVTVSEILRGKIVPSAIEFMDRNSIDAVGKLLERKMPYGEAGAHLLIQIDSSDEQEAAKIYEKVGEICMKNGAKDVLVADNRQMKEKLWEARRKIREAIKPISPVKRSSDVVVPRFKIPDLLERIYLLQDKHKIKFINYGHAGDGNVHVNILKENMEDALWDKKLPAVLDDLYETVVSMGGAISGEHGIGIVQKKYLRKAVGDREIKIMKDIKKLFDPNNILNPGKIF